MLLQPSHLFSGDALPFELKGSLFTLTVMRLFYIDQDLIERHLAEKVKRAPGFFNNTPVVIDLEELPRSVEAVDFESLSETLRKYGMVPMGIRNGTKSLQVAAQRAGLPTLPENHSGGGSKRRSEHQETMPAQKSVIVDHAIRSGQQVYAPDGDLIVLGMVNAGAEAIAGGNVHIYGPLRGRALAGVNGNTEAQIFCHQLNEAVLVSIAGRYLVNEQIMLMHQGGPARIRLQAEHPIIEKLLG